jgi:hypothetical protein
MPARSALVVRSSRTWPTDIFAYVAWSDICRVKRRVPSKRKTRMKNARNSFIRRDIAVVGRRAVTVRGRERTWGVVGKEVTSSSLM